MSANNPRLYQEIGEQLKQQIIDGVFKVGEKLPPERTICTDYGISRTVVREAIIMLELEGLVSVRKGSGIHVISDTPRTSKAEDNVIEQALRRLISEMQFTGPFEMLEARQYIECLTVELAASKITDEDLGKLASIQSRAKAEDRARDSDWDKDFHIQIARSTGNSVIALLVEMMWHGRAKNPLWTSLHKHIDENDLNSWCAEHQAIMDALAVHDPKKAQYAMWSHLESTKKTLYSASSAVKEE
ncbi:GntR family transcriptional regulator [Rhodobacteraceae bacterium RKSG542]|uniref:FCD domain-containing protein n=1 Tax=Pseudovibrio flavus TaxID=2529854 RepID=UPI0012BC146F|nr:FCD domain-containing protein [Pseudovibrio flavus]MTI16512.1 GntR family transcriptional regulator [Pseudovibrio flavus]